MRYGVTMFATDQTWRIDEVAVEAEAHGFASLWLPEHTHIPTSRKTPPPTGDAVLAEGYKRMFDPFVALAAAGARTERIRLGTGIALAGILAAIGNAPAVWRPLGRNATVDLTSHKQAWHPAGARQQPQVHTQSLVLRRVHKLCAVACHCVIVNAAVGVCQLHPRPSIRLHINAENFVRRIGRVHVKDF